MGTEHRPRPSLEEEAALAGGRPSKGAGREQPAGPQERLSPERPEDDPLKEESSSTESAGHEVRVCSGRLRHGGSRQPTLGARRAGWRPSDCRAAQAGSPLSCPIPPQHEEPPGTSVAQELALLEEERARVVAAIDRLKSRAKDLEQQLQETAREVSLFCGGPRVQGLGLQERQQESQRSWRPTLPGPVRRQSRS